MGKTERGLPRRAAACILALALLAGMAAGCATAAGDVAGSGNTSAAGDVAGSGNTSAAGDVAGSGNASAAGEAAGSGNASAAGEAAGSADAWTGGEYRFTDSAGRTVRLAAPPARVAALMGSYAETWLLAGGSLAGVTTDAAEERGLDLGEGVQVVGTVKKPNSEALLALAPDFVLLSTDIEGHAQAAELLEKAGIPYAFFKVEHFEDYLWMLKTCTDITGRPDLYRKNGLLVQEQIGEVLARVPAGQGPSVLFIRALSTAAKAKADDNMTCKMLEDLGADNIAARHKSLLEDLSMETILQEDPDFILVTTMGDSGKAIEALHKGIESNPAWASLSAVKNGRYIVLPKELFHYKPNARWGESYAYLAEILYSGQAAAAGR